MKDHIEFHIRSLEQRLDDMAEENAAITEQNIKLTGLLKEIHDWEILDLIRDTTTFKYNTAALTELFSKIAALHSDHPKS